MAMHHLLSLVLRKILILIFFSMVDLFLMHIIFFYLLYLKSRFLSVAYLNVVKYFLISLFYVNNVIHSSLFQKWGWRGGEKRRPLSIKRSILSKSDTAASV